MKNNTFTESRDVKGVVFAGGRGTRLRPLTEVTSKQLLPVGGVPMVERVINQLVEAEVKDILMVIDDRHASGYLNTLKDGSHLGVNSLSYVWQPVEGKGLPSAIDRVRHQARGSKIVCVCGDVLIEEGLAKPVDDFMKQKSGARIAVSMVEDSAGYSPIELDENGFVRRIGDKDSNRHEPNYVDLGVYMYSDDVFDRIDKLVPSDRGETEIWELNRQYISEQSLGCTAIEGWWADAGASIETYLEVDRRYFDK